ncbi:unnamed protein product [Vicia faba]|uniref:Uncharacterized protein n=1 Tax=Vicia faba TaxID=3906 RepID=A0AAV1AC44_VICFA|nr:unnamed protein product [Vicia faba]
MVSLPSDNNQQVLVTPTPSSPTNDPKWIRHEKRPPPELPPPEVKDLSYWVAFMVFIDMPQRCLDVVYVFLSENLSMVAAEQNLLSSQQITPSQMMSFFNLENQYNRIARSKASPKAKDVILNWIYLKIVFPKLMFYVCKFST